MAIANDIEAAVRRVGDQTSFIQELLIDALQWPIDLAASEVEEISYAWTAEELRADDLDKTLVDGTIRQIQPFPGNPWGIFLLEFRNPEVFTTNRGMTGTLRRVLRGLVPSKRRDSNLASFQRENLLFICNHNYEHFRFAHFKAPKKAKQVEPLAAFGWGPGDPIRTLCEFNLKALAWPETQSQDQWLDSWSEAFNVEKVTQRFYRDYAEIFSKAEGIIEESTSLEGDRLRMFTQSLFNRLMFVRFIERKRWLTFKGSNHYLQALFNAGGVKDKSFYSSRLYRLFFEGLAIEGKQSSSAYGDVPFLNGGLFEPTDLDSEVKDLPDEVFHPILAEDGLFYRYNFTVEESTPLEIEVAVDPEMLGKVFEELVTGRHESGSYYTPRPVVSFMCREAIKGVLAEKTSASASAIASLVDEHQIGRLSYAKAKEILAALESLKAVDPACGSGAYLLGLLHELIAIYSELFNTQLSADAKSLYELKLDIITRNIYGVDIDPFATNIAKLRLWLSLAVEATEPLPLPNLDFKIETGDSLLAPNPQEAPDLFRAQLQNAANVLAMQKRQYIVARGDEKQELRQQIIAKEVELKSSLEEHYGDDIVDWRIAFAEVFGFGDRGFDIVVANPPYIDSEQMTRNSPEYRRDVQRNFLFARGNWDIYIAFFELAFRLLNSKGILAFITPDKWISKPFGEALRKAKTKNVKAVLRLGRNVFSGATVDAIVTLFSRQLETEISVFDLQGGTPSLKTNLSKRSLVPPYSYDWLFSDYIALLERMDACKARLKDFGECENACATSDAYKLKELIIDEPHTPKTAFLKIINTGTIGRYVSRWGVKPMTYLGNRIERPIVELSKFQRMFPNSYGRKAIKPKIILKGLNLLDGCLDTDGSIIPGKTTLIVTSDDLANLKILLCVLNSRIAIFYIKEKYPSSSYNQGITFTRDMLNNLPIPDFTREEKLRLIAICDEIISSKLKDHIFDSARLEEEVDKLLCRKYCLEEWEADILS